MNGTRRAPPWEERLRRFLLERGEEGATPSELAAEALSATNAPPAVAEKIIASLLEKDPRFRRDERGRWRAVAPAAAGATIYTVVEFLFAQGPAGETPVEVGVARLEGQRLAGVDAMSVGPGRLAPGAHLPLDLSRADLARAPDLDRVLERVHARAKGTTLAAFRFTPFHARLCSIGSPLRRLEIRRLARRLDVVRRGATLRECAEALEVVLPDPARAADLAKGAAEVLRVLLAHLAERGVRTGQEVEDFLAPQHFAVDFTRYEFTPEFLREVPSAPGVYVMHDADGTPLYVGKAKDLRRRLAAYFNRRSVDERSLRIRERIVGLTVEPVGSELEALLLEHRLIREHRPELNRQEAVHARPEHLPRPANAILLLPSRAAGCVEAFLVFGGRALARVRVNEGSLDEVRPAIEGAYFGGHAPPEPTGGPEELEIVWSWLHQHRDRVEVIEPEQVGSLDGVMRLLGDALRDRDASAGRAYRV